jgi:hypothetical protein
MANGQATAIKSGAVVRANWAYWLIFGLVMGFALGGSTASHFYQPVEQPQHAAGEQHAAAENEEGQASESLWQRTTADPVAFFTMLLVLFTGVLAATTIALWFVSLRANKRQTP